VDEPLPPISDTGTPQEWWERAGERRRLWAEQHTGTARRVALVSTGALLLGLLLMVVTYLVVPDARAGLRAWAGGLWLLALWFLLMRTKTLTWSGYTRMFTVSLVWAFAIGLVATSLTDIAGIGPVSSSDGAGIGIASVVEECLKLVPLAVVGLVAPLRARRLSVADWFLLGWASGLAFLVVEETLRRLTFTATQPADALFGDQSDLPRSYLTFGLLHTHQSSASPFGFAGHHVTTALVAVVAGLAVALWRHAAGRRGRGRILARAVAVAAPLLTLVTVVVDHATYNASSVALDWAQRDTTMPWFFELWSRLTLHGAGRMPLLVLLVLAAMLVDSYRYARIGFAAIEERPAPRAIRSAWAVVDSRRSRLPSDLAPALRRVADVSVTVVYAVLSWCHIVVRDLHEIATVHHRLDGENRWAAMRRGRTLITMQRTVRDIANRLDAEGHRAPTRAAAAAVALTLTVAAALVGPFLATQIGADLVAAPGWLAASLHTAQGWWVALPFAGKAVTLASMVTALGLTTAGLGRSYALGTIPLTAHPLAGFSRAPASAIRRYLETTSPAGMLVDASAALAPALSTRATAASPGLVSTVDAFAAGPDAWSAGRTSALRALGGRLPFSH